MMQLRQRQPRIKDERFLTYIRGKRCCACGSLTNIQAAHLRGARPDLGKRPTGMGERPDDKWSIPLCSNCHLDSPAAVHKIGEARFFEKMSFDPFELAVALYDEFKQQ